MKIFKGMKKRKELKKWRASRDVALNGMIKHINDADDTMFKYYASMCALANLEIIELNNSK